MNRFFVFALILFMTSFMLEAQSEREFEMKEGDTTYVMKKYFMALYMAPEDPYRPDSLEALELQEGHMGFMNEQAEKGLLHIAGPFEGDPEYIGAVILDVETLEEATALMGEDPKVKKKMLAVKVLPWWAAKGSELK